MKLVQKVLTLIADGKLEQAKQEIKEAEEYLLRRLIKNERSN